MLSPITSLPISPPGCLFPPIAATLHSKIYGRKIHHSNVYGKTILELLVPGFRSNLPEFASRFQRSGVWPQTTAALYLGSMRASVCCQGLLQKANGSLRCTEISSRFTSGK